MIGVITERGDLYIGRHRGRRSCEHEGRDQGDACISQGTPRGMEQIHHHGP